MMMQDDLKVRLKAVEMEVLRLLLLRSEIGRAKRKTGRITGLLCVIFLVVLFGTFVFSVICATPLQEREYCKTPQGGTCLWTHAAAESGACTCMEQACVGFSGWQMQTPGSLNSDLWDGLYLTLITVTTIGYGDLYPQASTGRTFMIFYVTLVLGVIAYLLNILQTMGLNSSEGECFQTTTHYRYVTFRVNPSHTKLTRPPLRITIGSFLERSCR